MTGMVVNYTYGNSNWKDLLTEFDGKAITYDQIGNPLNYYNGTQFTWNYGRKLSNATTADGKNISYKYNDSGIRTQKTVDGTTTEYFLDGSTIIAEKTNGNTTWYYYDGDGTREAIEYNGNVYYYFYNAQGDVMGLFDDNLNVVVEYAYDSWGNVESITGSLADTLGQDNPFRYRGYYFDSDIGLYYLNSRYYDANSGRFLNADGYVQTGQGVLDKNMFAYCMNNPVNLADENGDIAGLIAIGVIALGLIGGGIYGALCKQDLHENAMKSRKEQESPNLLIDNSSNSNTAPQKNNNSNNNHQKSKHNKQNHKSNSLSPKQRVRNTVIGAANGTLIASGAVMIAGVALTLALGTAVGAPVAAIGMLAFGAYATVFMPFYGVNMELIEWSGK